jgi:hypothetical protein
MTKQVPLNSPSTTSSNISPLALLSTPFFLQHRYPFVAVSAHACISLSFPHIHLRIYLSRASLLDLDILLSTNAFVTEEFKAASTTRANELAWIWEIIYG